jgi:hypothetical protein
MHSRVRDTLVWTAWAVAIVAGLSGLALTIAYPDYVTTIGNQAPVGIQIVGSSQPFSRFRPSARSSRRAGQGTLSAGCFWRRGWL